MQSPNCPDRDKLAAFARGKLPPRALEPVAQHLRTCPLCESTVADLQKAGDTSAGELPSVARSQPSVPVAQSPTTLFRNRESACDRFEQAWKEWRDTLAGAPPRIDDYLGDNSTENERDGERELLIELVGMDLEYRWRSLGEGKPLPEDSEMTGFLPPRAGLSDYLAKYPALGPREQLPADLIAEEYRARHLGRDRPTHDEYLTQYAVWRPTLDELLVQTDWELVRLREGTLIRDYRLVRKIGRGGMGTVYQAVHTKLDKVVAVKVLPQERLKDREAVLRFQREMRAVGNLRHPNIVEAPDAGEADGMPYLVMEYVDGCDLGKLVGRMGPLPVAEACDVIRQAALGLEHAHEQGRVHRDVKPSNLMLSTEGQVKVLDLGLARLREDLPSAVGLSTGNRLMGTADYMAPEQAANTHAADIRADVYSLGCTLYALLAGHPPFAGPQYPSRAEKLVGHARDHAPLLDGLRPDVPEQLAALVARMLSKSPDQRPATPGEVAQALDAFAAGADLSKLLEAVRSGVRPDASIVGQLAPRAAAAAPSRRRNHWKRWTVMAAAAGLAILAGVITIVTDRGTLEINTLDEGVQVLVSRNGQKVTIVDTATGSTVTLHSGDYEVKLVGGKSGLSLDKDRITLRRGGIEVVKVIPPPPPPTSPTEPPRAIAPFDGQKAKEHQEAWAKYLGVSVEVTNAIGMKLVLIPPGEHVPSRDEKWTQFRVWLRRPLFCGKYEVTQAEFEKVMGTNPSFLKEVGPSGPVETVSRETAEDFCKTLSTWPEEQAAGRRYRLPTGVEWEFVCRAGTRTYYCFGDDKATLGDYAWYDGTSEKKTHPVGQKKPNAWGLYDMHGNVYEWCSGTNREIRGGAWSYKDHQCGSASHVFLRTFVPPRTYVGFRVLCELAKPSVPVTGTAQGSSGESARPATRVEEQ